MSRGVVAAIAIAVGTVLAPSGAFAQGVGPLQGSWKLVDAAFFDFDGHSMTSRFGDAPGGNLAVTADNRAILVVAPAPPAPPIKTEVAANLTKNSMAWSGKVEADPTAGPDGTKVTFHVDVSADPTLAGTAQPFVYKMTDGKLVLKSVPPANSRTPTMNLTFVKAQ